MAKGSSSFCAFASLCLCVTNILSSHNGVERGFLHRVRGNVYEGRTVMKLSYSLRLALLLALTGCAGILRAQLTTSPASSPPAEPTTAVEQPAAQPAAQPADNAPPPAYIDVGDADMGRKDYDNALSQYVLAWIDAPDNPSIITRIGDVFFAKGNYPSAARYYALAIKLNDDYERPLLNLGQTFLRENLADRARLLLEDAHRQQTFANSYRYFQLLGVVYDSLKQYDRAIATLQIAIKLSPDTGFLYLDLGNAQLLSNHAEDAVQSYAKAVAVNPNDPVAFLDRSIAFEQLEKYADAVTALQQYLTLSKAPDDDPQRKHLAELQAKISPAPPAAASSTTPAATITTPAAGSDAVKK